MPLTHTQNLSQIWLNLALAKQIGGIYPKKNSKGEVEALIDIGITGEPGKPEYYATEIIKGVPPRKLEGKILEKIVDGTDFIVQWNEFRGYKPGSNNPVFKDGQQQAPKSGEEFCGFECQKALTDLSLLRRNPIGQVILKNMRWNRYPNAFPIEEAGHFLYVPVKRQGMIESIPHLDQRLTTEVIEDVLDLSESSRDSIIFFNSLHAGGSVNHLHIQQVPHLTHLKDGKQVREGKYAIEHSPVVSIDGRDMLTEYPIAGFVYDKSEKHLMANDIDHLQQAEVPFNWMLSGDKAYLLPRRREFERVREFSNTLASLEGFGKLITSDRKTYDDLTSEKINRAFGKMSYTPKEILSLVGSNKQESYDPCNECAERTMGVGGEPCLGCSHAR